MTMRVRMVLMLMAALAMLGLASCDHYTCSATFGASSCTAGAPGLGGGGGTGGASAFVFVADTAGTIDGYTLNETAGTFATTPNYIAPTGLPSGSGNPSAGIVIASQKNVSTPFLYSVYPSVAQIYGFTVGATGDLTPMTPISVSSLAIGITEYNQTVVITNPQGTLLFISDSGDNQILVYQISSTGLLTPAPGSPFSTLGLGIEPQNLGMDGLGNYLFVSEDSGDHAGSFIGEYSVSNAGVLTAIGTVEAPLWEMQGDPSGQYLLGISGKTDSIYGSDDDNIYVYSINQTTGALTALAPSPTVPPYAPFNIAVQPVAGTSGALIYSFSINDEGNGDNPVEGYQLTPSSGALTALSGSPFTGAGVAAWGGFDPTGTYLFMYSEQSLTAYSVSSSGALTEIGPVGLNTGGYWAVADFQ
jgi:6-phosphogluconolactonase